jgi:hypothetical protein
MRTLALAVLAAAAASAFANNDLLPDIVVDEQRLYDNRISIESGRKLLRLSNGTANVGKGKFHIFGGLDNGDGTQQIIQRVFRDDGTSYDRLAGQFVYHPTHSHIHVEGWAAYRLREILPGDGVGDIVAAGEKTSFCILDLGIYDSSLPGFSPAGEYRSCSSTVQGLSIGWIDVYSSGLDGQSIDITGLPDGDYWLESVVDPDDVFLEEDETNNTARIRVTISDGSSSSIDPDPYEPNDTLAAVKARPVGAVNSPNLGPVGPTRTISNLTIDTPGGSDFFRFYMPATGTASDRVQIVFSHAAGDVDMELLNDSGGVIGTSGGTTGTENISLNGRSAGWYAVRVFGWGDATNPDYDLTIDPSANAAPSVTMLNPPAGDVRRRHGFETYTASFSASDPESNPTWVTLYANTTPSLDGSQTLLPTSLNTPGQQGSYVINSADLDPGSYYIYAQITDGGTVTGDWSEGTVTFYDCPADLNNDGTLDFGDVSAFVTAFTTQDLLADLNADGVIDFGDVAGFVTAFNAGC